MEDFKRICGDLIMGNKWLLVMVLIGVITRGVLCNIYDAFLFPYISKIENNNLEVLLCIWLLILLMYGCCANSLKNERTVLRKRNCYQLCFGFLILYYCHGYKLLGYHGFPYIYGVLCLIGIIEMVLLVYRIYKRKCLPVELNAVTAFTCDLPSEVDIFQREHYARILIEKIITTDNANIDNNTVGSFTILLNEEYGYGKTSFLVNLQQIVRENYRDCIRLFEFAPWLCESEETMVTEFFALLKDNLSFVDNSVGDTIDKYCKSLLQSKTELSMPFNYFVSDKIRQNSDELKRVLLKHEKPIVIIIDDVDRLKSSEILALLKLLRSTANLPHLYYIVAADKEFICTQLMKENINEPYEYLRKFVNFELLLPANDGVMVDIIKSSVPNILKKYNNDNSGNYNVSVSNDTINEILNYILYDKILRAAFKNPRDWDNYLNTVSFSMDILVQEKLLDNIHIPDIFVLSLLEFVNPKVYKVLRDKDDIYLELINMSMKRLALKIELTDYEMDLNRKDILSLIDTINAENNNTLKPEKEKIPSIGDYYKKENISMEQITTRALYILFGDRNNYRNPNRICFTDKYFMYFSGKKREQEITNAEAVSLFMSHETIDYKEKLGEYVKRGCIDSIVHKIHYLIDKHDIKGDVRVEFVKRFFDFWEIIAELDEFSQTLTEERQDATMDRYSFQSIFFKLYYSGNRDILDKDEKEKIKDFISSDHRYVMIFNFIRSFTIRGYQNTEISYSICTEFYNIVKNNVINEFLREDPFSDKSAVVMKCMKDAIHTDWLYEISNIIVGDALPWLYSMVKFYDDCCEWRYNFRDAVIGRFEGDRGRILDSIYSKTIDSNDIIADFENLRLLETLTHEKMEKHIFLKKAKEWWAVYNA